VVEREHYDEINALVASVAKAHGLDDKVTAAELENGTISLTMQVDENGEHYVSANRNGAEARIYQGVIRYAPGVEPPTAETAQAEDPSEAGK
jgi:hypothetical protein